MLNVSNKFVLANLWRTMLKVPHYTVFYFERHFVTRWRFKCHSSVVKTTNLWNADHAIESAWGLWICLLNYIFVTENCAIFRLFKYYTSYPPCNLSQLICWFEKICRGLVSNLNQMIMFASLGNALFVYVSIKVNPYVYMNRPFISLNDFQYFLFLRIANLTKHYLSQAL